MAEPTVCVKGLRPPLFAAAVKTGVPIPELAARFELAPTLLADLGARVPHSLLMRVWDELATAAGDASFGLTTAAMLGAPQLDLVDYVLGRAPSVRALCASFVRYQRLFHEANDVRFYDDGDTFVVAHRFLCDDARRSARGRAVGSPGGELARSRHFVEFLLAVWVARLRLLVGAERSAFRRVSFRHAPPPDEAPYARYFGCEVRFAASEDALALPQALMEQPLSEADAATTRAFERHLDGELDALATKSLATTVRGEIAALLRAGASEAFDIETIARRLALSRRSLQRRLAEQDSSFRDLVDEARREVALAELKRGTSTVTDVAFLLGFSESSAFSRAFRRWTGTTPGLFMKSA